MKLSLDNNRGFTHVELMIALLVFGLGVLGLAQALPNGMQLRDRARRMSVATALAQQQVESLRNLPFTHANLAAGGHVDAGNPVDGAYSRSWTVVDNDPVVGMKRVSVVVSFPTSSPDSTAAFTTLIVR